MKRKPLVRFETSDRAELLSHSHSGTSMPAVRRRKRAGGSRGTKGRPRVVKGRLSLKVAGYSGYQRLPPSSLIPYLPITKLRAAAKKALLKNRKRPTSTKRRGRRRTKRGRKKTAKRRRRR